MLEFLFFLFYLCLFFVSGYVKIFFSSLLFSSVELECLGWGNWIIFFSVSLFHFPFLYLLSLLVFFFLGLSIGLFDYLVKDMV